MKLIRTSQTGHRLGRLVRRALTVNEETRRQRDALSVHQRLLSTKKKSSDSENNTGDWFRMSQLEPWTSLGLTRSRLVQHSVRYSLQRLPELPACLNQPLDDSNATEALQRVIQIFSSVQPGGLEHQALIVYQAELQQQQGDYDGALVTLEELEALVTPQGTSDISAPMNVKKLLLLARAKVLWLQGNFESAKALCESHLDEFSPNVLLDPSEPLTILSAEDVLLSASTRTGQAVSRLLLADSLDDIFTVRDPFRMVVMSLESTSLTLPLVASLLNYGVAEAVYAQILKRERDLDYVPLDAALRSWKHGLTLLRQHQRHTRSSASKRESAFRKSSTLAAAAAYNTMIMDSLEARLRANMAWGLLEMTDGESDDDLVQQASEFARKSLGVYDEREKKISSDSTTLRHLGGWHRTLGIVAQCYQKSGEAVTSEGLYKPATDMDTARVASPLQILEHRDNLTGYSDLCRKWDKREGDAKRLQVQAREADALLPTGWQGKPGIISSLWFWLPTHMARPQWRGSFQDTESIWSEQT